MAPGQPHALELRGIGKRYGDAVALDHVDLTVRQGEFLALLGPSGSGKTTMLNLIAGLIPPSVGQILINGVDATDLPTSRRGIGMVFQNYALMPHMTIFENVAFPLQVRKLPRAEIQRQVERVLELVQIDHLATRKPREVSGGQQQRTALARCIVYSPALTLMDEPLGALDKRMREQMQLELKSLHARLGITIVYVTHDQQEALTMADRIVLLNAGRIEQIGTPAELYAGPVSTFAAEFLGDSNLLTGTVEGKSAAGLVRLDDGTAIRTVPRDGARLEGRVKIMVRPEHVSILRATAPAEANRVAGVVETSLLLGNIVKHFVRIGPEDVVTCVELNRGVRPPATGTPVELWWLPENTLMLPLD